SGPSTSTCCWSPTTSTKSSASSRKPPRSSSSASRRCRPEPAGARRRQARPGILLGVMLDAPRQGPGLTSRLVTAGTRHAPPGKPGERSRTISLRGAVLLIAAGLTPLFGSAADTKELNISIKAGFPSCEYRNLNGQLEGFDLEIGNEVCKRLNRTCV